MFSPADTIVAIATPPGRSGLGIVRLSGPSAQEVAARLLRRSRPLQPRRATFARLRELDEAGGGTLDQVVVTWFSSPASYTGEDVVEISAHGNPWVLQRLVDLASQAGARVAEPGEFTFRAYLNGRVDLVEAEAVADLIAAVTPAQARAASDQLNGTLTTAIARLEGELFALAARLEASLDFPEEGYRFVEPDDHRKALGALLGELRTLLASAGAGRVLREGRRLAVIGRPNVGKSSIFNSLLGFERAIVSPAPGTTRDLITEACIVHGVPLTLVDTAGWRTTADELEAEGIRRARRAAEVADVSLLVLDGSVPLSPGDRELLSAVSGPSAIAVNKSDLPQSWTLESLGEGSPPAVRVSALSGAGLEDLRSALASVLVGDRRLLDDVRVTNVRHARLLEEVSGYLERARSMVSRPGREEMVLAEVHAALGALQEITGRRAPDAVLREIFSRFCIGK
jgi:tRNA modification GTPase